MNMKWTLNDYLQLQTEEIKNEISSIYIDMKFIINLLLYILIHYYYKCSYWQIQWFLAE